MPRWNTAYAVVGRGVVQRGRYVGGGEERGEVAEVEVGLDEVGEREGRRRVGRAARPRGVEDRAGAREVAADHDPAADLDDGRVAARPRRQMPKCPSARGEQPDPQLLVGGTARAQDRYPVLGVGLHHPHLVGAPVADRPQRIGVAPKELGTHRVHGLAVLPGGPRGTDLRSPRGGAAPPHQPPHRRLHRLWTTRAPHELVPHAAMKDARRRGGGAAYDPRNAPGRSPARGGEHPYSTRCLRRECAPKRSPKTPFAPSSSMVRAVIAR